MRAVWEARGVAAVHHLCCYASLCITVATAANPRTSQTPLVHFSREYYWHYEHHIFNWFSWNHSAPSLIQQPLAILTLSGYVHVPHCYIYANFEFLLNITNLFSTPSPLFIVPNSDAVPEVLSYTNASVAIWIYFHCVGAHYVCSCDFLTLAFKGNLIPSYQNVFTSLYKMMDDSALRVCSVQILILKYYSGKKD